MNTKEIQQRIAKQQVEKGHIIVCENLSNYFVYHEADVLSATSAGYTYEFEVKITRQDFKKDSEKKKHYQFIIRNAVEHGSTNTLVVLPNYFSYVCPPGLIKGHEVPEYAGLYYAYSGLNDYMELQEVVKPPLLHKVKHDLLKLALKVSRVTIERMYLGGCKLTVKNNTIQSRNKRILDEAGFSAEEIKLYSRKK